MPTPPPGAATGTPAPVRRTAHRGATSARLARRRQAGGAARRRDPTAPPWPRRTTTGGGRRPGRGRGAGGPEDHHQGRHADGAADLAGGLVDGAADGETGLVEAGDGRRAEHREGEADPEADDKVPGNQTAR